jgi:hypothetical protein
VLVIGVAAGYQIGWTDAQKHDHTIVKRTIDRVGGSKRDNFRNDIDKKMERLETR